MELAYSGLHQLCAPMLDHLDRLPVPQRDALATVFGVRVGPAPDRFLVGLAALTLSRRGSRAAAADLHRRRRTVARPGLRTDPWVRRPPAPRRADRARVRGAHGHRRRRPRRTARSCPIAGLGDSDARALLLDTCARPRWMPRSATRSSRRATATHSRSSSSRARGAPQLSPVDLGCPPASQSPARSSRAMSSASASSPPIPDCFVLAAAAEPLGDVVLLHRAAESSASTWPQPHPAVDAGLLQVGGHVEFAHPLVRSATYRAAPAEDRAAVHRALAEATDARGGPGSARVAPRSSHSRPRRGGRRRARALGRPRTVSRRTRRGRSLSDTREPN